MLYEFGYQFHILDIFNVLFFILPFCLYLFSSNFNKKFFRALLMGAAALITVLLVFIFYIKPICAYFEIKGKINNGNVSIIEGEISNFKTPDDSFGGHESESFRIDNVEFVYYETENYGYSKFLCNGGVITGNGQKVRITYVEDPFTCERVICNIEKLE